jgi:alkylated DNA repair dioxygenase AlkB
MTHTLYKYGTTWFDHFRLPDDIQITEDDKEILWTMKPDKPQQITLFGKKMNTPRLQEAFGKSYTFSGSKFESTKPIPELCDRLIKKFNKLYRTEFNMVLINWYRDGDDYISMHSDNEKQIKENSPVITVSIGQAREFVLQNIKNKEKHKFILENNSVLVMGGTCQKTHKHGITKNPKIKNYRISLTFRVFN